MNDKNQNDFINNLFSVNLVLVCSENVKKLSINIQELFKQFKQINSLNGLIKDPLSNHPIKINSLNIKIKDVSELENTSSNSIILKKMLINSVQKFDVFDKKYQNSLETPWFDEWKKVFLNNFHLNDHEFIGSNFGSIFIISVEELKDVKNLVSELYTKVKQKTSIRWFQPNFFKYFVVLNTKNNQDDSNYNLAKEMKVYFDELIIIYGEKHCFWLDIELEKDYQIIEENKNNLTDNSNTTYDPDDPLSSPINKLTLDDQLLNEEKIKNIQVIYNEPLLLKVDTLLRELLCKALIPWSEKQIKNLNDAISIRKGFRKSIFSATKQFLQISTSTVNLRGVVQNNISYNLESNEMQNRKLADMAMCLKLFELAYNFYYAAKKDFQGEGAWLYFAGACEAVAISSYLMNKFQKHYFDQAFQCYLETCKSMSLATRTTLISTDIIRKIWPTEASSYFVKLISEDAHLRSALFLEQAAKCFMQSLPPKKRRANFHYILAGSRYNKSNLKKHALFCYLKYQALLWNNAFEHVHLTISKLYLQLSENTSDELQKEELKLNGLRILKENSYKKNFFTEYIKELNNHTLISLPRDLFELNIPEIKFISKESLYDDPKQICYVNEQTNFIITFYLSFELELKNLSLLINNDKIETSKTNLIIQPNIETTTSCWLCSKTVCDFEIFGIEYQINNFSFLKRFDEKLSKSLKFKSTNTLPLINCKIYLNEDKKELDNLECFSCEIIDLIIDLNDNLDEEIKKVDSIRLYTKANLKSINNENLNQKNFNDQKVFSLNLNFLNNFKLHLPYICQDKSFEFKIEYSAGKIVRSIKKNIKFQVKECLQVDHSIKNVVSLRNILKFNSLNINLCDNEQNFTLKPSCVGHFLIDSLKDSFIFWSINNRNGCINVKDLGL